MVKKDLTVGTVPKYNRTIVERGTIDTTNSQIHDVTHKYMTTNIQIHDH